MTHRITMLAVDGCWGTSLLGVSGVLHTANRIAGNIAPDSTPLFEYRLLSPEGKTVQCEDGHTVGVNGSLDDLDRPEILFLPAFSFANAKDVEAAVAGWQPLLPWLRDNAERFELVATSCSGTFLLAEAGLLDGHSATTSWWLRDVFARRYPHVHLDADAVCVRSGRFLIGGSSTSYMDVCLAITEQYGGKFLARLVSKYLLVDNQRRSQAPYAILSLVDNSDPVVERAERWIRRNLQREFRIEEVAAEVAVSPRTLIRRFQSSIGESPQSFTQRLRIEKSKILLETTGLRLGEIIQRCGYSDESAFRRLFKKYCQVSPREYRRRFNTGAGVLEA